MIILKLLINVFCFSQYHEELYNVLTMFHSAYYNSQVEIMRNLYSSIFSMNPAVHLHHASYDIVNIIYDIQNQIPSPVPNLNYRIVLDHMFYDLDALDASSHKDQDVCNVDGDARSYYIYTTNISGNQMGALTQGDNERIADLIHGNHPVAFTSDFQSLANSHDPYTPENLRNDNYEVATIVVPFWGQDVFLNLVRTVVVGPHAR
jgi:hypothetical protein